MIVYATEGERRIQLSKSHPALARTAARLTPNGLARDKPRRIAQTRGRILPRPTLTGFVRAVYCGNYVSIDHRRYDSSHS
jgi:hypothetical protein